MVFSLFGILVGRPMGGAIAPPPPLWLRYCACFLIVELTCWCLDDVLLVANMLFDLARFSRDLALFWGVTQQQTFKHKLDLKNRHVKNVNQKSADLPCFRSSVFTFTLALILPNMYVISLSAAFGN